MRLSELEEYSEIYIQPHDNPDPDALASAFGLYVYFTEKGKNAKIVYSGRTRIKKSNLVLMKDECEIPIEYVEENTDFKDALLITVDCQHGEGNVTNLKADHIAIIDHHQGTGVGDYREVVPYLGSCSTLVWSMMRKEGFKVDENLKLGTAFYYGLMTDTGNFMEVSHPLDRDMMDSINYSKALIKQFTNSNISLQELEIAGEALIHYDYDEENECLIIHSKPCDPNILGFVNDLALQVDKITVSVVFNEANVGYKLSVRSCSTEVKANDLASYLTETIGSGGGHTEKAGGYIDKELFHKTFGDISMDEYLKNRLKEYFENSEIIYAKEYTINLEGMKKYKKKHIQRGFVDLSKILPQGTPITIRTLEGDVDTKVDDKYYILIGLKGEVYPILKEKFYKSYHESEEEYEFHGEYDPAVHIRNEGRVLNLIAHAKGCINFDTSYIYAKEIEKIVKIFTFWDEESYYIGRRGDFIACREDDHKDVYIIERDIFFKTYEPA
ncbi:MAG: DHH family phosphoesterase [Lachnospiraceae bacterium]|nr:DHH family phosphoesterase [Lachnospiraceae bacterium]